MDILQHKFVIMSEFFLEFHHLMGFHIWQGWWKMYLVACDQDAVWWLGGGWARLLLFAFRWQRLAWALSRWICCFRLHALVELFQCLFIDLNHCEQRQGCKRVLSQLQLQNLLNFQIKPTFHSDQKLIQESQFYFKGHAVVDLECCAARQDKLKPFREFLLAEGFHQAE